MTRFSRLQIFMPIFIAIMLVAAIVVELVR